MKNINQILLLLATEKQFSPGHITVEDFLHLLEKEMLVAARDMIQNKQAVKGYGSSGPWVNGPQWQQMSPTHCTVKRASWSENQIPLPVSPNSEVIKISWTSEKPLLLFPSPICSKQPGLLTQEGNKPPVPHCGCWGPLAPRLLSASMAGLPSPASWGGQSSAVHNLWCDLGTGSLSGYKQWRWILRAA